MSGQSAAWARKPLVLALFAALAMNGAQAQVPAPVACQAAPHRQFDFWLGHWEVFAPDGTKAGENLIEAVEGGCVLLERWQGRGGFTGSSLNSWNRATGQWHQHWADNQGGLLRLEGGWQGDRMVLSGREPNPARPGSLLLQRISWIPLAGGQVRQLWEQSADEGQNWSTVFDGRYERAR